MFFYIKTLWLDDHIIKAPLIFLIFYQHLCLSYIQTRKFQFVNYQTNGNHSLISLHMNKLTNYSVLKNTDKYKFMVPNIASASMCVLLPGLTKLKILNPVFLWFWSCFLSNFCTIFCEFCVNWFTHSTFQERGALNIFRLFF